MNNETKSKEYLLPVLGALLAVPVILYSAHRNAKEAEELKTRISSAPAIEYRVQAGDTLANIARSEGVPNQGLELFVDRAKDLNPNKDLPKIEAGRWYNIPDA